MIRIIAKLFAVAVGLAAYLNIASASAAAVTFIATNGSGSTCAFSEPCQSLLTALGATDQGGQITCFDTTAILNPGTAFSASVTIDCPGLMVTNSGPIPTIELTGTNQTVRIRNLTISGGLGGTSAIKVTGSGTLIIENCVFENMAGVALDIEPNSAFNLVVTNSRISSSGAGVVIKPAAAGGRVTAAFNGVTIADNTGGGLKTDSTIGGLIEIDVSNSTISNNAGNGMNAVGGAGGSNVLNVGHSVIASNGTAGIQANGGNAAVSVDTTLLDLNNIAISTVNNGKVFTYGNNRIIGPSGAGFSAPIALQ